MKIYYGPEVDTDAIFTVTYKSRTGHLVKIPKDMIKRVMEGNKNSNYLTLTCAVTPGRLWPADIVGRKISFGWEKFAKENRFVDGDLLLFKYNGSTRFHVECFSSPTNTVPLAASGNERRKKPHYSNTQEAASIGDTRRFVTLTITADKIEKSRMYLPQGFCTANGLHKFAGKEVAMGGAEGTSIAVKLKTQSFPNRKRLQLSQGLREFFEENDIHTNDQITLELVLDNMPCPKLKLISKVILVPN